LLCRLLRRAAFSVCYRIQRREKFDTYRFADYKEKVIDLLARVTTVSVETMKVVAAMKAANR
jgi:hypothetical protein